MPVLLAVGLIFFVVMAILLYVWRIPGIPLSRRFGDSDTSKFVRPERLAFFKRAAYIFAIVFATLSVSLMIYTIYRALKAF